MNPVTTRTEESLPLVWANAAIRWAITTLSALFRKLNHGFPPFGDDE